ncbi:transcription initiation factor TFIIIB [Alkalicoccobacillus murimartini]|uniref:DUF3973 domain-containing protein n=1 Tax=Alkalicoccobacillus murimartini TaxID=171685 RepID=A0ABT9YDL8_9BACI|nr:transcription initiation factor TFIIIB [Alkalicoccobacillus murimartini]MDQ0205826.1 hypothetical protein [Alkalicoccobacillus murimartini]
MKHQLFTCTKCGGTTSKSGEFNGYAKLSKTGNPFSLGSAVTATFCGDCCHIEALTVNKPERF